MKQVCVGDFHANRFFSSIAGKAVFQDDGLRGHRDQDSADRKMHIAPTVVGFHTFPGEGRILPHGYSFGIRTLKSNSTRVPLCLTPKNAVITAKARSVSCAIYVVLLSAQPAGSD